MSEDEKREKERLVSAACATLSEHFEAVQILVSYTGHTGTGWIFKGQGNIFARQGMARQFVVDDFVGDLAIEIAAEIGGAE